MSSHTTHEEPEYRMPLVANCQWTAQKTFELNLHWNELLLWCQILPMGCFYARSYTVL